LYYFHPLLDIEIGFGSFPCFITRQLQIQLNFDFCNYLYLIE